MSRSDSKIGNIQELRDHALRTIEKLANGEIDTSEAGVTGKLCESVISTVKAQLEYSKMIGEEPAIPFMNGGINSPRLINAQPENKALPHKK